MKVTNEKTENRQAFLTIEMEPVELEESLESSYRRLVKKAKIPGFRKGKAPREILERYIGKESLLEDALNNLVPDAYEKAIAENDIEAIAQPQIEITQTEPVIFKAVVPLKPEITLGDYKSIRVNPESVEINKDNINAVIEQLRHQNATWEPVERPVDFTDLVVIDIESNIEGEPFMKQKGVQYQVLRDQSFPAPGFSEQLIGLKTSEEKEFKLKLPSDYPRSELAEKEPEFKVKINEIKEEILPELNDEFAKQINPEFETLDSLEEQVSSSLKQHAEEHARADFEEKVIDAVVELSQVEFPPILVDSEIHRIIDQRFQGSNQRLEDYLRSVNKTEEELHEELHEEMQPLATKRVTRSLVLGKVSEEEKIEVNDSDIDAEIENMIQSTSEKKEELKKALNTPEIRESIERTLLSRKTMQRLTEIAQSQQDNKAKTRRKKKEENK